MLPIAIREEQDTSDSETVLAIAWLHGSSVLGAFMYVGRFRKVPLVANVLPQ